MSKRIFMVILTGVFVLAINSISLAMMCGEHSGDKKIAQAETGTQTQAEADTQALPKETVNVGNKICPVSEEKINEKIKATYEYEGKIYNFCCSICIDEFKKDPQKYIKKVNEELQAESKEKAKESQRQMQMRDEVESSGDQDVHRGRQH